jgi:hypothetical protein
MTVTSQLYTEFDSRRPEVGIMGVLFGFDEPCFPFVQGGEAADEGIVRFADERDEF